VVGIAGGIGSGKTTLAGILAGWGAVVLDADRVGHGVIARGGPAHRAVVERFGEDILGGDGEIVRARLAAKVFGDAVARDDLNAIVHPAIRRQLTRAIEAAASAGAPLVVVDAALLLEAPDGLAAREAIDRTVLVTAPVAERVRRVRSTRDYPKGEVEARIESQIPEELLAERADEVLANDGDLDVLRAKARDLWIRLTGSPPD
jgi:dephospho-CoA kinase